MSLARRLRPRHGSTPARVRIRSDRRSWLGTKLRTTRIVGRNSRIPIPMDRHPESGICIKFNREAQGLGRERLMSDCRNPNIEKNSECE